MIGRATPAPSSGIVSSRQSGVVFASAALHTPSPFRSLRWLVSGLFGSSAVVQTPPTGFSPNGSSMSARFFSPSPFASVSTTAASAKARTMKLSLPSSPSSRSSAWFE